jgi:arsenate reductase (glutaredoxin)
VKLTSVHWSDLAKRLKIEIKDLINCESSDFLQRFKGVSEMGEQDWLTLLIQNPQILKAPIVLKGKSIAMMCNPQDILQFVK